VTIKRRQSKRRRAAGPKPKPKRLHLKHLGRRRKGPFKIRVVAFVSPELAGVIYSEADARDITIGDVVEEAFQSRARMIKPAIPKEQLP